MVLSIYIVVAFLLSISETTLSKEGIRGSKLDVTLEYTQLKPYEVSSRTDEQEFLEKYEKPTEDSPGEVLQSSFQIQMNVVPRTLWTQMMD